MSFDPSFCAVGDRLYWAAILHASEPRVRYRVYEITAIDRPDSVLAQRVRDDGARGPARRISAHANTCVSFQEAFEKAVEREHISIRVLQEALAARRAALIEALVEGTRIEESLRAPTGS